MKISGLGVFFAGAATQLLVSALVLLGFFSSEVLWAETIKGNVRYVGAPIEKKKTPVTIDQYVCGKEKDPEDLLVSVNNGIKNAVVSLQNIGPETKRDWNLPPAKMDQKQCSFTPRVVIVPVGGTVEFLNSDRLLHNVRSAGKENPPFNRAQPHARSISFRSNNPSYCGSIATFIPGCAAGWSSPSTRFLPSPMSRVSLAWKMYREESTPCRSGRKV